MNFVMWYGVVILTVWDPVRGAKVKSITMSDREEEAGLDPHAYETMSAEENGGGERTSLMVEKEVR